MIKKIKRLISEYRENNKQILIKLAELEKQSKELEWAHIYHESIRGREWLENLPLNIGRWAGNYSFFYILNRVLNDYKPKRIIEFGLGESSKFVSSYLIHHLEESSHLIIEQDTQWRALFESKFVLSSKTSIEVLPLVKKKYKEYEYNGYENLESTITSKFDLYIIDGPFGSDHYSRFDIYGLVDKLKREDEFVIMIDDYDRQGEKETVRELLQLFKNKEIKVFTETYSGIKSIIVIVTEKYKYITSL